MASNQQGLELERYEIERLLARMDMTNVSFSCREDGEGYDWDLARRQIELADFFILLVGDDYGPMAPTGISYLHREFVHARTVGKPVLAFLKKLPVAGSLSVEQGRLKGFYQLVTQQVSYKLWHLRDELLSFVRAAIGSLELNADSGWVRWADVMGDQVSDPVSSDLATASNASISDLASTALSVRERLEMSRKSINLMVSAKVYQGGNLSREEMVLPARLDQLYRALRSSFVGNISEDRLRACLEAFIAETVRKQLLGRRPNAHAVDDIRVSKSQFRSIMETWERLGQASRTEKSGRYYWVASEETPVRTVGAP
ncbi:DUF4062 domain-containing protein [Oceanobacter sp. 4_MG-2023]|uniref:DUF4062 domain-containing protein n=1 Tax=Oceanobacter sp. 4_MG-2023 TaxID=3062623 RepID=UPI002736455B|nr:DUF4062 domain-containing protein [Oceanobacter sp. 4_MG-2023]MDP2546733.1 DUF4062 domain-containing protein [Oceanobacter sp. 4_MG-2023]